MVGILDVEFCFEISFIKEVLFEVLSICDIVMLVIFVVGGKRE